jgi:segregation and condensation protein B
MGREDGTDGEGDVKGAAPERDADGAPTSEIVAPAVLEGDTVEIGVPEAVPREDTERHAVVPADDAAEQGDRPERSAGDTDEDLAAVQVPDASAEPPSDEAGAEPPSSGVADAEAVATSSPTLDTSTLAGDATDGTDAAEASEGSEATDEQGEQGELPGLGVDGLDQGRIEGIIESLLFAADRPLGLADLKRLLGERDGKKIGAAVEALQERRAGAGVVVISAAGGWQLRTNPENAPWVGKLLAGKPVRLSRAMMETLSIVAYRQPVTRPEIDDIRGVDCGPVLKTLLDRGLIRIIGKKEEVGRPLLYGTTPEFLRTFSLRDLTELPTLREFHELGRDERAEVEAKTGAAPPEPVAPTTGAFTPHPPLAADPEEDDGLLEDLDRAAQAAVRATEAATEPTSPDPEPAPGETEPLGATGSRGGAGQ